MSTRVVVPSFGSTSGSGAERGVVGQPSRRTHVARSFRGRTIFVRNTFTDLKHDSARFEQAFSADAGKSWESNWTMTWTREKEAPAAPVQSGRRTAP